MVRSATPEDLPRAAELIRQLHVAHGEAWDTDRATARTVEIMDHCDCYMIGDPPVAFASLQDAGDYVLIRHFCMDEAERGKGQGRTGFDALEAHAFAGRKSRLYASTVEQRPRAFWEKMGYDVFAYTMQRKPGGPA